MARYNFLLKAVFLFSTLIILLVTPLVLKAEEKVVSKPVKIGAILSLTGDLAFTGKGMQQGIDLALSQRKTSDFEVLYEDDMSLNRVASVNASKKLIHQDNVTIILNDAVNTVTALAPILNSTKTLGLVIWDSNKTISSLGDYVFGFGYSTEDAGETMAEYAASKLSVKKAGVIYVHDEWSELIAKAFTEKAKTLGVDVEINEGLNVDASDFRSIISRARQKNLDAVYAPLIAGSLVSWFKQVREGGFQGHLLTADGFSENEVKQVGRATEGTLVTQLWISDPEFIKSYEEKFGESSNNVNLGFVALGYDIINCLSKLKHEIEGADKQFNSESLKDALLTSACEGLGGKTDFAGQRLSKKKETLLIVRNGALQPVILNEN